MNGIEKVLVVLLLVVGMNVFSQRNQPSISDIWSSVSGQDDNEKNFKFPAFIGSLKDVEGLDALDSLKHRLPSGWSYATNADTSLLVLAGILPFDTEPDRLIWLVEKRNAPLETEVFTTQLPPSTALKMPLNIKLGLYEIKKTAFVSLTISLGTSQIFKLPDIYAKLVLQSLLESKDDNERLLFSQQLWTRMELLLGHEPLFNDDFSGYEQVSTLQSPDGLVKVMTWNLALENGTNAFRGAVAVKRDDEVVVHELTDSYLSIKNPEQAALSPDKWYGAVYYELLENSFRRNTFYTLLGYNPNNPFSKIRIIEVMSLSTNGTPRFANAIIEVDGRSKRRIILEYSNRVSMMLRYDADQQMIVMDNLVPSAPMFQNDYRHYGPDFTHNGVKFEKGKWLYIENVELRNTRAR